MIPEMPTDNLLEVIKTLLAKETLKKEDLIEAIKLSDENRVRAATIVHATVCTLSHPDKCNFYEELANYNQSLEIGSTLAYWLRCAEDYQRSCLHNPSWIELAETLAKASSIVLTIQDDPLLPELVQKLIKSRERSTSSFAHRVP